MIEKYYRSNLNLLNTSMQLTAFKKYANKFYGLPLQLDALIFFKKAPKEIGVWNYLDYDVFFSFQKIITDQILKEKEYSKELEERMANWFNDYDTFVKKSLNTDINTLSEKEIIELLRNYLDKSYATIPPAWSFDLIGWSFSKILEDKLKVINKYSQENVTTLASFGITTIFNIERIAFLELLKKNLNKETLATEIEKHYSEWNYIGMESPLGEPFTFEYYQNLTKEYTLEKVKLELQSISEKKKTEEQEYQKLLQEINPDKETKRIIDILRTWIYHKNYERILIHKYILNGIKLLSKLCKQLKIPELDENWLTVDELVEYPNNIQKYTQLIKERKEKGYIIKLINSEVILSDFEKDQEVIEDKKELTGIVASKGEVSGKVKIITELKSQINEFTPGEILVTNMTTPDYLPLMKISKAVITNEGNILCHAAIVSRELGIPCIVGVKNATQILKNGDNIEIKNENGIGKVIINK